MLVRRLAPAVGATSSPMAPASTISSGGGIPSSERRTNNSYSVAPCLRGELLRVSCPASVSRSWPLRRAFQVDRCSRSKSSAVRRTRLDLGLVEPAGERFGVSRGERGEGALRKPPAKNLDPKQREALDLGLGESARRERMLRSQTQDQSPQTVGKSLHLKQRNTATIAALNLVSSHTMIGRFFFVLLRTLRSKYASDRSDIRNIRAGGRQ